MTDTLETSRDIHTHFGLSYANYLVLPRTLLQSMPKEWQHQFVALLDEFQAAFAHVPQADCYKVEAVEEHTVWEMTETELKRAGIRADWYGGAIPPEGLSEEDLVEWRHQHEQTRPDYTDADGHEVDQYGTVLLPTVDPVPYYNRGRTRIEPALGGGR